MVTRSSYTVGFKRLLGECDEVRSSERLLDDARTMEGPNFEDSCREWDPVHAASLKHRKFIWIAVMRCTFMDIRKYLLRPQGDGSAVDEGEGAVQRQESHNLNDRHSAARAKRRRRLSVSWWLTVHSPSVRTPWQYVDTTEKLQISGMGWW